MQCRLGVLPTADGSALLVAGMTKVLAAVYGPREAPQRSDVLHDRCALRCECTYVRASAVCHPLCGWRLRRDARMLCDLPLCRRRLPRGRLVVDRDEIGGHWSGRPI